MFQFTLSSPNRTELYDTSRKLMAQVKNVPGVTDAATDLLVDNPEVHLNIDRDKCSRRGLTVNQVEDALDSAYANRQISTMYTQTNQYWVIIEVAPEFYKDHVLHSLYLHSATGTLISLNSAATWRSAPVIAGQSPQSISIGDNLIQFETGRVAW